MTDSNEFLDLVKEALPGRITIEAIAYRLEISVDYAKQLRDGKHKISAPIRAKLDALIAAKDNGPVDKAIIDEADDSIEPSREQFEVDLQAEATPEGSRVDGGFVRHEVQRVYIGQGRYEHKVVQVRAVLFDADTATAVCRMLNKEGG